MTSFKPLNTKKYVKAGQTVTADTLYWKRLNVSKNAHKLLPDSTESNLKLNLYP